jgi:hypothetical protein
VRLSETRRDLLALEILSSSVIWSGVSWSVSWRQLVALLSVAIAKVSPLVSQQERPTQAAATVTGCSVR